jgi:alkylhydroperoxidase family enzyme
VAAEHLGGTEADYAAVVAAQRDVESAPVSEKMKALLTIAALVARDGKLVTAAVVDRARRHGATDQEIHDVVLIAAAFCMFNRYVDGLGTWQPDDPEMYRQSGKRTAELGYLNRSYTPISS